MLDVIVIAHQIGMFFLFFPSIYTYGIFNGYVILMNVNKYQILKQLVSLYKLMDFIPQESKHVLFNGEKYVCEKNLDDFVYWPLVSGDAPIKTKYRYL